MRQMMLTEILLNPSVKAADEPRLSAQALKIWKLFCLDGDSHYVAVWTSQLVRCACQYHARLNDLRNWLMPHGLTIDNIGSDGRGNHKYEVRELAGSNYEKRLKKRGLI